MKTLLIAALVLGFAAPVFAQAPQSSPVAKEATQKNDGMKAEKAADKAADKAEKKADKAEKKAKRAAKKADKKAKKAAAKTESAPAPEAAPVAK